DGRHHRLRRALRAATVASAGRELPHHPARRGTGLPAGGELPGRFPHPAPADRPYRGYLRPDPATARGPEELDRRAKPAGQHLGSVPDDAHAAVPRPGTAAPGPPWSLD